MWWNKKKNDNSIIEITEGIRLIKEVKFQRGTGLDRSPCEYILYEVKRVQFLLYENGQMGEKEYSEFVCDNEVEASLIFDYLKKHNGQKRSEKIENNIRRI